MRNVRHDGLVYCVVVKCYDCHRLGCHVAWCGTDKSEIARYDQHTESCVTAKRHTPPATESHQKSAQVCIYILHDMAHDAAVG